MRIAYLINQYPKVSHSFIRREIQALERQGVGIVRIAVRGWDADLVGDEDRAERQHTHYVLRDGLASLLWHVALTVLTRPLAFGRALAIAWQMRRGSQRSFPYHLAYLGEACVVARWLRTFNVRHLHAHFGTNSAEVAMLTSALCGVSWSFTVHGPEEFDKAEALGLAAKLAHCNFVIAISSYGRSQIFRHSEQNRWPRVHVVHCGLERAFHARPAVPPPTARKLVCVGRLCREKGQLLLIEAAREIDRQGVEFELVLAGDGELRSDIEILISRYGLGQKVHITGWIDSNRVREEILTARALVLPSFAEGLPVVIMEAMALRRPVISTYVAGIPELVRHGIDGWLVPAGDVDALVAAMRSCLETGLDVIASMGDEAHARVLERHDVDREAKKLLELFRDAEKTTDGFAAKVEAAACGDKRMPSIG